MSTYKQQQAELNTLSETLTRNANADWLDGDFGGIDTAGWDDLALKAAGITHRVRTIDHSARKSDDMGGMAASGSKHPVDMTFTEADYLELERRDPKFKAQRDEQRKEAVTSTFTRTHPTYIPNARNYKQVCEYIKLKQLKDPLLDLDDVVDVAFTAGFWTVENLHNVFEQLKRQGKLEMRPRNSKDTHSR